jgi:flagellar hook-associated protein 2
MGRISTGIGLISGINSRDIIDQLMQLEARPKVVLQNRIETINMQRLAFVDMRTRLTSLRVTATSFKRASTFENTVANSNNDNVLTASTSTGAAVGSYQFQVARLVSTQQSVSRGFTSPAARIGAGTLTIEMGGGELKSQTTLADLRGGEGIRRGMFRITDRAGNTAVIDTTTAVTLDDVVMRINMALETNVRARVGAEGLVLSDQSGGAGNFIVQDLGDGQSAADLGIVANVAAGTITGGDINYLGRSTRLAQVNDGRGVRSVSGQDDFRLTAGDGTQIDINLGTAASIGEVLDLINQAGEGKVRAELAPGGNGMRLVNLTGGALSVTSLNGSKAAGDLGIDGLSGSTVNGGMILADLNGVLLSSLNGGGGLELGTISITDRSGASNQVNLSGARTVRELLERINSSGLGITATLNAAQNGIQITDTTGGMGPLAVTDVNSTAAEHLGIAGSFDADAIHGANLQRQWVSENTLLRDYNGGRGVTPGRFRITDSSGASAVVNLTQSQDWTIGQVIEEINARGLGVAASINETGDGLLLTDTIGGGLPLRVEEVEGTAARDLNILGASETGAINGSFEKTAEITDTDTLESVQQKINELGFGVSAAIINDGSGTAPYRLTLTARNSGVAGRVVFDTGTTTLGTRPLIEAQDAAVFIGGAGADQPLLITSSRNQLTGVIRGVTIELHGTSSQPVTLNVTRSIDNVATSLDKFADGFNEVMDRIAELTRFDTATNKRGLLMGDPTIEQVRSQLYNAISGVVEGAGRYKVLAEIGLRLGDGARLQFDEEKFRAAHAADPDAVKNLFAAVESGFATLIETRINRVIDPADGLISRGNQALDSRAAQFEQRIKSLDKLIEGKRLRLERQYAQLESVLANLQSQQQAISQMQFIRPLSAQSDR